jgi:hypothetical protein
MSKPVTVDYSHQFLISNVSTCSVTLCQVKHVTCKQQVGQAWCSGYTMEHFAALNLMRWLAVCQVTSQHMHIHTHDFVHWIYDGTLAVSELCTTRYLMSVQFQNCPSLWWNQLWVSVSVKGDLVLSRFSATLLKTLTAIEGTSACQVLVLCLG